MRYRWSGDEFDRILIAERLGRSRTLLSAEELIDALRDPSYNVRHEAIHAVGSMRPHPKLVDALVLFLGDNKTDLSLSAAYALGKIKDRSAILPLRETLLSEYRLLRARSARALAMLGDTQSSPYIHMQLKTETDQALRIAYASSLGGLRYREALDDISALLYATESPTLRAELALALARLVGDEQLFVRLLRRLRQDCTTSAAQIVLSLRRELPGGTGRDVAVRSAISDCALAFGSAKMDQAAQLLSALCDRLPLGSAEELDAQVVALCRNVLGECGAARLEYISLLLHTIVVILRKHRRGERH
jgi:HEAT repeat protein